MGFLNYFYFRETEHEWGRRVETERERERERERQTDRQREGIPRRLYAQLLQPWDHDV